MPARRDVAAAGAAIGLMGISFGVLATSAGVGLGLTVASSVLVMGGGSQLAMLGVVLAGGSPAAAVASGLLLNTRFLALGLIVAPVLPRSLLRRMGLAQVVGDHSAAFTLAAGPEPAARLHAFRVTGLTVAGAWVTGTAIGALAGEAVPDPRALGLDAALPAGIVALLAPMLRDGTTRLAALGGIVTAVALVPVLPAGGPVIAAALVALVGLRAPRRDAAP